MSYLRPRYFLFLLAAFFLICQAPGSYSETMQDQPTLPGNDVVRQLQEEYGGRLVLGNPLEVGKYRLVPVIRMNLRSGLENKGKKPSGSYVASGKVRPMGILVFSPEGFDFIRIHESLTGQIFERLPVILHNINALIYKDKDPIRHERLSVGEILATAAFSVPERIFGLGIVPWWVQKLIFVSVWYIVAFITACLFTDITGPIIYGLARKPLKCLLSGIGFFLAVVLFSTAMALTVIGLPLSVILVVFYVVSSFIGRISIGMLIGGLLTGGVRIGRLPVASWLLSGGAVMAAVRMIPVFGWIIWFLAGIWGFGGVIAAILNRRTGII